MKIAKCIYDSWSGRIPTCDYGYIHCDYDNCSNYYPKNNPNNEKDPQKVTYGDSGFYANYEPCAVDVMIHIDKSELKYLDMKEFPKDPKELTYAIHEAIYLAYARI